MFINMSKVALLFSLTIIYVFSHQNQGDEEIQFMDHQQDFSKIVPPDYFETFDERYGERHLQQVSPQPIRITLDFSQLDNAANGEGMTPEKRQYLINIVEVAKVYLSKLLKVIPRTEPVMVYQKKMCYDVKLTQEFKKDGINNSDLHIFVTYVNDETQKFRASAMSCQLDPNPVAGRIAFNLAFLKIDPKSTQGFQDNLSISLHEIFHILGFSGGNMKFWINPDTGKPYGSNTDLAYTIERMRWGTPFVTKLFTKNVLRVSRAHYNCPSIDGMFLENQGGGSSMGSHWEKDLLGNEFMTPILVSRAFSISEFSGAILQDTGYYAEVNNNIFMPLYYGKNKGCDFFNKACNATQQFPEFAYPDQPQEGCDYYSVGLAKLKTKTTITQCSNMVLQSNYICEDDQIFTPQQEMRQNTGAGSRCFRSNAVQKGNQSQPLKGRCFKAKCSADGQSVDVNVWGDEFVNCKQPNQMIDLSNETQTTQGIMYCPQDFELFCNFPSSCPKNCSNNGLCNNSQCICVSEWAGEDCSIKCPSNYAWDGTNCVQKCPSGTYKNFDNVCRSKCLLKQYQDDVKGTCELCHANCAACTGGLSTQCTVCNPGFTLNRGECYRCDESCATCSGPHNNSCITCPEERFLDLTKSCKPCKSPCATCSNFRDLTKCNSCIQGYYLSSKQNCLKCSSSCKSCSGTSTQCTECINGYVLDQTTNMCVLQCDESCKECSASNDSKACISCISGKYLKDRSCLPCQDNCLQCADSGKCSLCIDGYTLSNEQCIKCKSPCKNCSGTENSCIDCIQGYIYDPNNKSCFFECHSSCKECSASRDSKLCTACVPGSYLKDGQCLDCEGPCSECKDFATFCTSCQQGYYHNANLGTCTPVCGEGEYTDNNIICKQCEFPCANCFSKNKCRSCVTDHVYDEQTQSCQATN